MTYAAQAASEYHASMTSIVASVHAALMNIECWSMLPPPYPREHCTFFGKLVLGPMKERVAYLRARLPSTFALSKRVST